MKTAWLCQEEAEQHGQFNLATNLQALVVARDCFERKILMFTKFSAITLLAGVAVITPVVPAQSLPPAALSSDGKLTIGLPALSPTTRSAEDDAADVAEARNAVGAARNDAAAAQEQLRQATVELRRISGRLQNELETNNNLAEAKTAYEAAAAAYEKAIAPVLADLAQRAEYRAASADLAKAQRAADQIARSEASPQERVAVAQAVLSAKTTLANLKREALADNTDVVNAGNRRQQAAEHLRALRLQLGQAMHQDPNYLAAMQGVADARELAATAEQQATAADKNRATIESQAADHASARQRFSDFLYSHGVTAAPSQ
jgi:hypothetical protein